MLSKVSRLYSSYTLKLINFYQLKTLILSLVRTSLLQLQLSHNLCLRCALSVVAKKSSKDLIHAFWTALRYALQIFHVIFAHLFALSVEFLNLLTGHAQTYIYSSPIMLQGKCQSHRTLPAALHSSSPLSPPCRVECFLQFS